MDHSVKEGMRNLRLVLVLAILFLIALAHLGGAFVPSSRIAVAVMEWGSLLLVGWLGVRTVLENSESWANPFSLLFFTIVLFLYSRIISDLTFGVGDYGAMFWIINTVLSNHARALLMISMLAFSAGSLMGFRKPLPSDLKPSRFQGRCGLALFVLGLPLFLNALWQTYKAMASASYLELFTGSSGNMVFTNMNSSISTLGFYLYLSSNPQKKRAIAAYFVFLAFIATTLIRGNRAFFVCNLLVSTWYLFKLTKVKIKLSFVLSAGLGLMLAMNWVQNRRELSGAGSYQDATAGLQWVVYQQGVSLSVPAALAEGQPNLHWYDGALAFLSPFEGLAGIALGWDVSQATEPTPMSFSLGRKLTHGVNPEMYFMGYGLGTSNIGEAYLLGGAFACLVLGFLLFRGLGRFYRWAQKDTLNMFVFLATLPFVLFTPRETVFCFLLPMVKALAVRALVKWRRADVMRRQRKVGGAQLPRHLLPGGV